MTNKEKEIAELRDKEKELEKYIIDRYKNINEKEMPR